jgi:hypothetical protein
MRRISQHDTRHYSEIYEYLKPGALLRDDLPASFARAWRSASASTFAHVDGHVETPLGRAEGEPSEEHPARA